MMKIVMLLLFALVACKGRDERPENRLFFHDVAAREMLVAALKEEKISHRIDAEGVVWYLPESYESVDNIAKAITSKQFSGRAISFEDLYDTLSFREKLVAAKIPYKTKIQFGKEWTNWEEKYDSEVKLIESRVEKANSDRRSAAASKRE